MRTTLLQSIVISDDSKQIISNIKKELLTAEGEYKEFLLTSLESETPGSLISNCLKEENEKELTVRINRDGKEFYHVFFLNNNNELDCVVFDEWAQICNGADPQLKLAEALCKKCIVDGENDDIVVYFGCQFRIPESYKSVNILSDSGNNESSVKRTITEFQAEELTYETGKAYAEIAQEYNIVDVTDHMNHGEEFY